ncbi:MAG TPA: DUF3800 domain-containing protein [Solirubrobacterales bacterium]|nr:DUF3800 domain-containing protein [Solirubrobacterales bacterium]
MYLLFLDESGSPADDEIFALGGVAIRADDWTAVKSRWSACLEESGWPSGKELKWSGVSTGEVPPPVADAAFACLAGLPIHCLATVLYTGSTIEGYREKFFRNPDVIYQTALTFTAERYQRFLAHEEAWGAIVLDSRQFETDNHMRRYFDRIHEEGTDFAELDRIVDGLLLGPSHHSLGLQLADLVIGPTRKSRFSQGDASRYFKQLEPCFMKHPVSGELEGVGLKVFPDSSRSGKDGRLFNPR